MSTAERIGELKKKLQQDIVNSDLSDLKKEFLRFTLSPDDFPFSLDNPLEQEGE